MKIPFNKLHLTGYEIKYIQQAIDMESVSGDGYFTSKVSNYLEDLLQNTRVFMLTSGSHALEMAMMLLDLSPGDEVIMPSYTFPSTANAVLLHGGNPVFVDIELDTLSLDLKEVKKSINNRTKAILPVHYGGVSCKMDDLMKLAGKYGIMVIEDAAQGLGSKYNNKYLGTLGHMGCISFHGTKNCISGEGGALCINVEDKDLIERCEMIRQKGTDRHRFIKGEVDQYTWRDIGSSYAPSDILMAMLYAQLGDLEKIISSRKEIYEKYINNLKKYVDKKIILSMSNVPDNVTSNYHNFYILMRDKKARRILIEELNKYSIKAYTHFVPLHNSPMGIKLGLNNSKLPVTEFVGDRLVRLPLYTDMSWEEVNYVIEKLKEILEELN